MPSANSFAAGLLAGGRSSRMDADKAFVPWNSRRLIDQQVATLRTLEPVELLISGRPGVDYAIPGAPVILDAVPDRGPLGGLAAILEAMHAPQLLILAIDLPRMTPTFLRHLLTESATGQGAVPRTAGGWEPLAAVYPREILPLIQRRLARQELALQALIDEAVLLKLVRPVIMTPEELTLFANLNTPDDLRADAR